jgi:DNA-binding IclR family transcriptional regulator
MTSSQSLERGLAILDRVASGPAAMGVRDIARATGWSPSIVQRLVNSLNAAGYLEQEPETKRYRLGYRALVLGAAVRRDDRLIMTAVEELEQLATDHRLNGYLGAIRNNSVVYLESIQSSGPIQVRTVPGATTNAHSTALGKALLAELPDERVTAIVGSAPFQRLTSRTITTAEALAVDLQMVRSRGYAIADQENIDQILSVGAVIRDARGDAVAAISVAYLAVERPPRDLDAIAQLVIAAAGRCSRALGFSGRARTQPLEVVR